MQPNKKTYIYIGSISLLAFSILSYLVFNFNIIHIEMLVFWIILTILVESLLILLPNKKVGISVGSAINLAAIIVGGPLIATISAAIGFLFRFPKVPNDNRIDHLFNTPYYVTLFNVSQSIVVTGIMGLLYIYLGGVVGKFFILQTLFILFIGTLLNTIIISLLIGTMINDSFIKIWISNMRDIIPSVIAVGTIGIIMALSFISYGYGAVLLFLGPLLLARYSFKLYIDMRNVSLNTIESLSKALDAKDSYTSGHASRVQEYSVKLAKEYGLSSKEIEDIKIASILHDIGKIGISDDILNKPGRLTDEEFEKIKEHTRVGADIIGEISFLKDISKFIRYHHERYDGRGYPEGIKENEIPIEACIIAIADSYDAMTYDRPYRAALTREEALEEIEKNSGTQFHPTLAQKFLHIMRD